MRNHSYWEEYKQTLVQYWEESKQTLAQLLEGMLTNSDAVLGGM